MLTDSKEKLSLKAGEVRQIKRVKQYTCNCHEEGYIYDIGVKSKIDGDTFCRICGKVISKNDNVWWFGDTMFSELPYDPKDLFGTLECAGINSKYVVAAPPINNGLSMKIRRAQRALGIGLMSKKRKRAPLHALSNQKKSQQNNMNNSLSTSVKWRKAIIIFYVIYVIIMIFGTLLFFSTSANAQPVARPDTIWTNQRTPEVFKADTIRTNILKNDSGTGLYVLSYNINGKRYAAGTTWRSVAAFGKIRLDKFGNLTFVTIKPVAKPITDFAYSIDDGKTGTSFVRNKVLDSAYWYLYSGKVWIFEGVYGERKGYYHYDGTAPDCCYSIIYNTYPYKVVITREEYMAAMALSGKQ